VLFTGPSVVRFGAADPEDEPQSLASIAHAGVSSGLRQPQAALRRPRCLPTVPVIGPLRAGTLRAAARSEIHVGLRPTWTCGD
jgi:hypothetical protein